MTKIIQNEFETERKKQNVCVYGLKENVDKSDSELMIEIANFLEIDNTQNMIMEATRAGRTDDPEKIRPLIIKTSSIHVRNQLLKNAPKLKNYRNVNEHKIYIAPDLTFQQRVARRQKREEERNTISDDQDAARATAPPHRQHCCR